jgi:hypothetical protein
MHNSLPVESLWLELSQKPLHRASIDAGLWQRNCDDRRGKANQPDAFETLLSDSNTFVIASIVPEANP